MGQIVTYKPRSLLAVSPNADISPETGYDRRAGIVSEFPTYLEERCHFDFVERYGPLGRGFIEAHHLKPLSELTEATVTRTEDIALVCAGGKLTQ